MAEIIQAPAALDITGVSGSPLVVTLTVTATDSNGDVIPWDDFSYWSFTCGDEPSWEPTVDAGDDGTVTLSWTAEQTAGITSSGAAFWVGVDIDDAGPYAVVAGQLACGSPTDSGTSTSSLQSLAISVGASTVNVSLALGGSSASGVQSVTAANDTITVSGSSDNPEIAVTADTYDAYGAAATAQSNAEAYAASEASAAQSNAETYAASAASTAQSNAETYAASEAAAAQAAAEAASLPLTGGTMSGAIAMGSHKITGLENGSASSDGAAYGQIPVPQAQAAYVCRLVTGGNWSPIAPELNATPAAGGSFYNNTNGQGNLIPVTFALGGTIEGIGLEITTAVSATTVRLALYADDDGFPGSLIEDFGTIDSANTGILTITGLDVVVDTGVVYWFAAVQQGSTGVKFRYVQPVGNFVMGGGSTTANASQYSTGYQYTFTGVTGSYPSSLSGLAPALENGNSPVGQGQIPEIIVQAQ